MEISEQMVEVVRHQISNRLVHGTPGVTVEPLTGTGRGVLAATVGTCHDSPPTVGLGEHGLAVDVPAEVGIDVGVVYSRRNGAPAGRCFGLDTWSSALYLAA